MAIGKEILRQCLVDKQQEIDNLSITERDFQFEENGNYVFVGVRRVGKSYVMYQRVKQLQEKGLTWHDMLFVNFEDERLVEMGTSDLNLILETHYQMYGADVKPVLFFDEIQNVPHWDKFVRRLADGGYRVYVTGSNAKMLSSDVATTLGGRFLISEIYPYSFKEFLNAKGFKVNALMYGTMEKGRLLKQFVEYFHYGGLPETLLFNNKRDMLSSLYQKIYLGDVCMRNRIRNAKTLEIMVKKLAESVCQPISYNRLQRIVKSTGQPATVSTISEYVSHLMQAWLLVPLENEMAPISDRETVKKYYFIDNGILQLFLTDAEPAMLENLVAVTLFRKYGRDKVYFLKNSHEIDFYLPDTQTVIQVCVSLSKEETYKREIVPLLKFSQNRDNLRLMIITMEEKEIINMSDLSVEVVPVWEWLLNFEEIF